MRAAPSLLAAFALLALSGSAQAQSETRIAEDEKLLQAAGVGVDGPSLLAFLRKQVPTKADAQRVEALIQQLGAKQFKAREQAGTELIAVGPPALPALRKIAKEGDLETQRRAQRCIEAIERRTSPQTLAAAARLVKLRRPEGACAVLLDLLPLVADETAAEELLEGVYTLGVKTSKADQALNLLFGLGRPGPVDEVVLAALKDPAPARCAAAALVVGRHGTPEQRQAVRPLLDDDNPLVRLRAAQGLACARDRSALPALIALLGKSPLPLARQAEDMLTRAAGASATKLFLGEDAKGRLQCQRAWEEWWGTHKEKLDLARADLRSPFAGQVLLARAITRQFLETMMKGEIRKALALADVPFAIDGFVVLKTRAELDALFGQAMITDKDRMEFTIKAVVPLEEYLRKGGRPPMEEFLKVVPKASVRAVYVEGQQKQGRRESAAVFVRFQGSQARIVGLGVLEAPGMPAKK